jgi:hypothetical protein
MLDNEVVRDYIDHFGEKIQRNSNLQKLLIRGKFASWSEKDTAYNQRCYEVTIREEANEADRFSSITGHH